jgi:hypothetical protein
MPKQPPSKPKLALKAASKLGRSATAFIKNLKKTAKTGEQK